MTENTNESLRLPRDSSHFFSSTEVFVMTPTHYHDLVRVALQEGLKLPRAYVETEQGVEEIKALRRSAYYYFFTTKEHRDEWRLFDEDIMVLLVLS
ncbi:MAG: hypothetical protein JSV66_01125 [Trueperaceae bacterium]|nr:MAG: hypothetical protein JSV66_01125 [Trueperaceae bacterium]